MRAAVKKLPTSISAAHKLTTTTSTNKNLLLGNCCNRLFICHNESCLQNAIYNRGQSSAPYFSISRFYSVRLAEVGRLESKQSDSQCYAAGQPFLHRVFGYRGLVLFPWLARVHDIDLRKQCAEDGKPMTMDNAATTATSTPNNSITANTSTTTDPKPLESQEKSTGRTSDQEASDEPKLSTPKSSGQRVSVNAGNKRYSARQFDRYYKSLDSTIPVARMNMNSTTFHPYYQVLIDIRDCPFVSSRTQTEAVTFLGHPDSSKSVYSIKGLDYVAHEDIIPYTSHERLPIQHELHMELFKFNNNPKCNSASRFVETDALENWKSKHPWLELSRVYKESTENIRVTVIPFYLGHTTIEEIPFHWWRYCVRLENLSGVSVQLRERHWKIFSQTNMLQTIKGRGVVGVEPILTKNEPAYQYSSHVNLQDRSGLMWGTFKMQREDGHTFECKIPPFSLESSVDTITPPGSKRQA